MPIPAFNARSDFIRTLQQRGYIYQCSALEALDSRATEAPLTAYIGFDCTANSLHVGHLIGIMMLRRLQKSGHHPIALLGGGTTRIGDPSGKNEARKLLDETTIAANIQAIGGQLSHFLNFSDGAVLANNADWLNRLDYIDFLREYGQHFSVNRMLTFESVKNRLGEDCSLSFLEFNYMVLQAYDFVELQRRHDCVLQMGGSDQWGNIVCGIELGRRVGTARLYGLTTSLLTTASGRKMGKTESGAIWLDADRVSPYDYYQFWRNTDDADCSRFLRLFTDLDLAEIDRLDALDGAERNEAKKVLAYEATTLAHGDDAAQAAARGAVALFEQRRFDPDAPALIVTTDELQQGIGLLDLCVRGGLAQSNGEARRHIRHGGLRLNGTPISDERTIVTMKDCHDGAIHLIVGKKRHMLVRPQS